MIIQWRRESEDDLQSDQAYELAALYLDDERFFSTEDFRALGEASRSLLELSGVIVLDPDRNRLELSESPIYLFLERTIAGICLRSGDSPSATSERQVVAEISIDSWRSSLVGAL